MVSLNRRAIHGSHDFEAGCGVSIVSDDVAHADVIGHSLSRSVGENCFESLKIGMYVTEESDPHRENREWRESLALEPRLSRGNPQAID